MDLLSIAQYRFLPYYRLAGPLHGNKQLYIL